MSWGLEGVGPGVWGARLRRPLVSLTLWGDGWGLTRHLCLPVPASGPHPPSEPGPGVPIWRRNLCWVNRVQALAALRAPRSEVALALSAAQRGHCSSGIRGRGDLGTQFLPLSLGDASGHTRVTPEGDSSGPGSVTLSTPDCKPGATARAFGDCLAAGTSSLQVSNGLSSIFPLSEPRGLVAQVTRSLVHRLQWVSGCRVGFSPVSECARAVPVHVALWEAWGVPLPAELGDTRVTVLPGCPPGGPDFRSSEHRAVSLRMGGKPGQRAAAACPEGPPRGLRHADGRTDERALGGAGTTAGAAMQHRGPLPGPLTTCVRGCSQGRKGGVPDRLHRRGGKGDVRPARCAHLGDTRVQVTPCNSAKGHLLDPRGEPAHAPQSRGAALRGLPRTLAAPAPRVRPGTSRVNWWWVSREAASLTLPTR